MRTLASARGSLLTRRKTFSCFALSRHSPHAYACVRAWLIARTAQNIFLFCAFAAFAPCVRLRPRVAHCSRKKGRLRLVAVGPFALSLFIIVKCLFFILSHTDHTAYMLLTPPASFPSRAHMPASTCQWSCPQSPEEASSCGLHLP